MNYIQDYLSVLPQYDREQVEILIKDNIDLFEVKAVSKEEFEALIQQLATKKEKLTVHSSTGEYVDAEHFNNFHSNVALDLKSLYHSHMTTEKVIANYDRILSGTLEDIQREINELSARIEELNLKAKGEKGLIVKTYGFDEKDKHLYMENDREQYPHLFTDRDGSSIEDAAILRSFSQYYITLPLRDAENALEDKNKNISAAITIEYARSDAKAVDNHPIAYAIDDSEETYWYQEVICDEPAYTKISKI